MTFEPNVGYSDSSRVNCSKDAIWKEKISRSSAKGRMTECGTALKSGLEDKTSLRDDQR